MPKPRKRKQPKSKPDPTPQELVDEAEEALDEIMSKLYAVNRKVSALRDKLAMATTRVQNLDGIPF